ncbi:basic leucine zipper 61-like isoform X1 [Prunus yedoensis var. nudiflora]|uniref:Basic leucine zipper 61-like isoform X1 n=1 Tax=Prunus yedoensis var. nudiflora TaxID=2094558 RepID=A0A314XYZ1_PRUYE|nr:basic leucine zipper 61-like isoform X1 [Prunus yedoensis var. nudiflora]
MAQLPPKIPSMAQNWPSFPHQRLPTMANFIPTTATSAAVQPPSQPQCNWIDEFLDFSSARRGAHRRSASDSIAFMESPLILDEECRNPSAAMMNHGSTNNLGFDRLDDEQLMSMFSDDMSVTVPPTVSSSNPSTPEPGEDESSCEADPHAQSHPPPPTSPADPKRVKSRILANRQSAQRSRVRKLQYISELERSVTTLQSEVSALSPRVAFLDHQRLILNVDNSALKQRIAALAQDKLFKDAHQEALKKEIERLRQVYHHQSVKKMGNQNAQQQQQHQQHQQQQQPNPDIMVCTDHNEQQILN